MDLSKLPRFNKSAPPRRVEAEAPVQSQPDTTAPRHVINYGDYGGGPGMALDVWLTLIIGVIFLLIGRQYFSYHYALWTHKPYSTGLIDLTTGLDVPYWSVQGFAALTDRAMFLFGVAVILDSLTRALTLVHRSIGRWTVAIALMAMLGAVAVNFHAAAVLWHNNITPLWSVLAIGFGLYCVFLDGASLRVAFGFSGPRR